MAQMVMLHSSRPTSGAGSRVCVHSRPRAR